MLWTFNGGCCHRRRLYHLDHLVLQKFEQTMRCVEVFVVDWCSS